MSSSTLFVATLQYLQLPCLKVFIHKERLSYNLININSNPYISINARGCNPQYIWIKKNRFNFNIYAYIYTYILKINLSSSRVTTLLFSCNQWREYLSNYMSSIPKYIYNIVREIPSLLRQSCFVCTNSFNSRKDYQNYCANK